MKKAVITATIIVAAPVIAGCSTNTHQSMASDIRALSYRVDRLEKQKAQTELAIANPWRALSTGQSEDQVRGLLGEPERVDQVYDGLTWWYYGEIESDGKVVFERGEVESWTEPH